MLQIVAVTALYYDPNVDKLYSGGKDGKIYEYQEYKRDQFYFR